MSDYNDNDYSTQRRTDNDLSLEEAEEVAFKQLLYGLVSEDGLDIGPVESVARIIDRIDELEATNERLRERVGKLEANADPHPESKLYDKLTRDEKVQQIRESLVEKASARQSGKFQMGYKDVMWLFDGHPSAGHTYKLMELAGAADGFGYDTFDGDRTNRIRVNLEGVNDETLFHAANNGISEMEV